MSLLELAQLFQTAVALKLHSKSLSPAWLPGLLGILLADEKWATFCFA